VQQVKESLLKAKARILGVILNKVQDTPGSYYNYYSYYQAYKQGDDDEQAPAPKQSWIKESLGSFRRSGSGRS